MKAKLENISTDLAALNETLMDQHGEGVLENAFSHEWFPQNIMLGCLGALASKLVH